VHELLISNSLGYVCAKNKQNGLTSDKGITKNKKGDFLFNTNIGY